RTGHAVLEPTGVVVPGRPVAVAAGGPVLYAAADHGRSGGTVGDRRPRHRPAPVLGRADPRRADQADGGGGSGNRTAAAGRYRPGRPVPTGAARATARDR